MKGKADSFPALIADGVEVIYLSVMERYLLSNANGFGFQIKIERLFTHFTAPTRLLKTTEGHVWIKNIVAVDPSCSSFESSADLVGLGHILRPNTRGQSKL